MLACAGRWNVDDPVLRLDAHDWWLRAQLQLDAAVPGTDSIGPLRLHGLGGLVDVWVNGQHALRSDNMFQAHVVDWRPLLRPGVNTVHLRVASLDAALQARRARPRWRTPMAEHQQLRWFRQTLLGRTPGWSPPAPPLGPWRDIEFDPAPADSLQVETLSVTLGAGRDRPCPGGLSRYGGTGSGDARTRARRALSPCGPAARPAGSGRWHGTLDVQQPALWWPHTHGEPALYAACLHVRGQGCADPVVQPLRALGFRSLAVDTADGDFALRVNGVPVFCRGACWMPLDPLGYRPPAGGPCRGPGPGARRRHEHAAPERHHGLRERRVLRRLRRPGRARVADLMFASMDYPADDAAFAASVGIEVDQQLSRWQARPCLAVVCGNSEGGQQAAMWGCTARAVAAAAVPRGDRLAREGAAARCAVLAFQRAWRRLAAPERRGHVVLLRPWARTCGRRRTPAVPRCGLPPNAWPWPTCRRTRPCCACPRELRCVSITPPGKRGCRVTWVQAGTSPTCGTTTWPSCSAWTRCAAATRTMTVTSRCRARSAAS
jgi:beta-mannosidase